MRSVRSVRSVSALALGLAALGLPGAPVAAAQAAPAAGPAAVVAPAPATVTVTGAGSASAAPDMAVLTAGIEVTRPTAEKALTEQNAAAEALLSAVRAAGVAERDIRTENLSLTAVYRDQAADPNPYEAGGRLTRGEGDQLIGYQATQMFSLTIRDIKKTGAVVQAVVDAPGDASRIHSVAFDVRDPQALRAKARKSAYQDVREKAAQYAGLSGRRLGRLVSLEESDGGRPRPVPVPVASFSKEGVPVAPGRIQDEVTVTAVYELR
ncbi:SIMPL domain-containing protein [Streptomyces sp. KL118A]|uniref:SIMPL domain-containing protein n=1 Tax=Streptomyces sp. KL118A TaxID=3045153 RepID=UPI00278C416E|nr:SIMPL domain-containing protein [Streptomyces sp. KL118A]